MEQEKSNIKFCEFCFKLGDEVRPYGPKDEKICLDCAMKNPEVTRAQAIKHAFDNVKFEFGGTT